MEAPPKSNGERDILQKQRTYPLLLPPKPQSILLLLAGSSPRPRANHGSRP
jgi:hypothetical protein